MSALLIYESAIGRGATNDEAILICLRGRSRFESFEVLKELREHGIQFDRREAPRDFDNTVDVTWKEILG